MWGRVIAALKTQDCKYYISVLVSVISIVWAMFMVDVEPILSCIIALTSSCVLGYMTSSFFLYLNYKKHADKVHTNYDMMVKLQNTLHYKNIEYKLVTQHNGVCYIEVFDERIDINQHDEICEMIKRYE